MPPASSFADHFSSVAARYASYRPHYPPALAGELAALAPQRDLAWDAGCGNGQLSVDLAHPFARVVATDPSRAQLDAVPAGAPANLEFRCERAEASTLAPCSVDLVVAAQAAHWFDWPRFVGQAARVARPGALVALVSYGILDVEGDAGPIVARYYRDDAGPHWPPGRHHVENGYRELAWPWAAVAAPPLAMTAQWTREELVGYVATWSATATLVRIEGAAKYDALAARLAASWPDGQRRIVSWPLAIRLARIPARGSH